MSKELLFTGGVDSLPLGSDIQTPHTAVGSWWAVNILGTLNRACLTSSPSTAKDVLCPYSGEKLYKRDADFLVDVYKNMLDELKTSVGGLAQAIDSLSLERSMRGDSLWGEQKISQMYEESSELPPILIEAGKLAGIVMHPRTSSIIRGATLIVADGRVLADDGAGASVIWPPESI